MSNTRRNLLLRLGIWVAFFTMGTGLIQVAATDSTQPLPGTQVQYLADNFATNQDHDHRAIERSEALTAAEVTLAAETSGSSSYTVGTKTYTKKNATELLPAWRWRNGLGDLSVVTSARDSINVIFTFLASIEFTLSSFIWAIILWAARVALTTDFVGAGAESIDTISETVGQVLFRDGPAWILMIIAGLAALYAVVLRDNLTQGLRRILTPAIAVAAMVSFAQVIPPSEFAQRGVALVDLAAAPLVGGVSQLPPNLNPNTLMSTGNTGNQAGCVEYTNHLYSKYSELVQSGDYAAAAARENLKTISLLWQAAMQRNWTQAQFSGISYTADGACHRLEKSSGVDPAEHQKLMQDAYKSVLSTPASEKLLSTSGDRVVDTGRDLGFVACYYSGGWKMRPGFAAVGQIGGGGNQWCNDWWSEGELGDELQWKTERALASDVDDVGTAEAREVKTIVKAYWGHNNTDRLLAGMVAALISLVYAYALGGVLLGGIVAQVGLVLLLCFLPYVLLFVGIGGLSKRRLADTAGGKMLKLTAGFFGAKAAVVIICTLILQATLITQSLLRGVGGLT